MKNKILFWVIFVVLLLLIPLTLVADPDIKNVLMYPTHVANLTQRLFGLILFVLLFWQIMLGAYMEKLTDKLGGWIFNFHIGEGVAIYLLALLHPLAFLMFRHFSGTGTDPIFVYLGYCLFCQTALDFYYTIGRIALALLTVGVFVGLYRNSTGYLRRNWRSFHVINYVVFLIVGIHGFLLGTDFTTKPFSFSWSMI